MFEGSSKPGSAVMLYAGAACTASGDQRVLEVLSVLYIDSNTTKRVFPIVENDQ